MMAPPSDHQHNPEFRNANAFQNAIDIASMRERLLNMEHDVEDIKKHVDELITASSRVKGAIFVVLMLGGVIGWLTTLGSTVAKIWPFHS